MIIKTLKTNGISGLKVHTAGEQGVTKIVDNSIDAPENYVLRYEIYVNDKNTLSYENGAYEIEYEH
mgnify:CR=1 FL=1|tara:strand:- start:413 stop:610 length:198 start_codon:yes stop_codon:yes gene_type:complete